MTRDEIKETVSMRSVLEERGIQINRAGFCKCPFHHDGHPSMKVYKNSVYCFSECNKAWDLFSFVMEYDGVDFPTAFQRLGGTYEHMTTEKKREISEVERKRKLSRIMEAEWRARVDKNNKMITAARNLIEENKPYMDERGEPVISSDWTFYKNELESLLRKHDELQEEGRLKKWTR